MAQRVKNLPATQETQETWVRSLGWEDPLEEGMATHSSILAWRIPWTEELGRMAMGLQRDTIEVTLLVMVLDFPDVSVVKNPPANAGDIRDEGSIPGLGRSPGGGHGNTLQYSCLENPMDRGAWPTTVHKVTKSQI